MFVRFWIIYFPFVIWTSTAHQVSHLCCSVTPKREILYMKEPEYIFLYPLVIFPLLITQLVVKLFFLNLHTKIICLWIEAKYRLFLILCETVFRRSSNERISCLMMGICELFLWDNQCQNVVFSKSCIFSLHCQDSTP